jgi:elongation factor P
MITATELSKGVCLNFENELVMVVGVQNIVTGGRVGAMTKLRLKNIRTGGVVEKTVKPDEKYEDVELTKKKAEYLYQDGENCFFMDNESYEQFSVSKLALGKAGDLLTESLQVFGLYKEDSLITVELPPAVNIRIKSTLPPQKGEQSSNKSAVLDNGAELLVPHFIKEGDTVRIDTLTGDYIGRVSDKPEKEEKAVK